MVHAKQFHIENVSPDMMEIVLEFPRIFLEPSNEVMEYFNECKSDRMCDDITKLVNLRFGFEHGNGWKEIVRGFCKDIQDLCNEAAVNGDVIQYKGCIIKEKWGEFTPQGDVECDKETWKKYRTKYYAICNKWKDKSITVCEKCGKDGKLHTKNWFRCLCDECAERRYKE